jgi:hypothetical protein
MPSKPRHAFNAFHAISCLPGSVADPGSGAFLTPGSAIRDPKPIFLREDNFLGKKFFNSLKIGPSHHFKNKIISNFVKFVATKKV